MPNRKPSQLTMTRERAQQILDHRSSSFGAGLGPMTQDERDQVNRVWDTMPGNTCFTDALLRVAKGAGPGVNTTETQTVKAALKGHGLRDRFCVRHRSGVLHIYLSKAVRADAALMAVIEEDITRLTGRRSFSVPGRFARFTIQPTYEERVDASGTVPSGEGGR